MIPARFSQLELNRELNTVMVSRVKSAGGIRTRVESSRHLESNALTTTLSRQDT